MSGTILAIIVVATACCCSCRQDTQSENQPAIARDDVLPVAELIEQLASPVPAKFATGEWERLNASEGINGYIHPQVSKAREQLVTMGTKIYPALAERITDDRYSYSGVYAAWVNHSVGQMLAEIMADGIEPHVGSYKSRRNPKGSNGPPSFAQMVKELGGFEKYALYAKDRPKAELQKEYTRWHVANERNFGFVDDRQEREVIGEYLKLLEVN